MSLGNLRTGNRKWHMVVISGPNLRAEIGDAKQFDELLQNFASQIGVTVEHFQSNHEGQLLEFVHVSRDRADAFLVNPGGLVRVGESLRHTLKDSQRPCIEVHLNNNDLNEKSIFSPSVISVFSGFGKSSYLGAMTSLALSLDDIDFLNPDGAGPLNRSHGAPRSLYI